MVRIHIQCFSQVGRHEMAGGRQEDALRVPSKGPRSGRTPPGGVLRAIPDDRCQKTKFRQPVPLFGGENSMGNEKDIKQKDDKGGFVCRRCGRCCRGATQLVQGDATIQDVACWIGEGRYDILQWVGPIIVPDSEDAMFDVWVNPKTHDFVKRCPWLRRQGGSNVHECTIYDVRPAACREWPANIADGQKVGCPACQEKSPGTKGQGIKIVKPHRDDN